MLLHCSSFRGHRLFVGRGYDNLVVYDSFVIGLAFQEALVRQVHDLKELLGDNWEWVGVGRDDGVERGEFSPIFYNK